MIKVIWPEYISLNNWAAALVTDYPNEPLPILNNESEWEDWAMVVINTGVFAKAGLPAPLSINEGMKKSGFTQWEDWAKIVYTNMIIEDQLRE